MNLPEITEATVRTLARYAHLPLPEGRESVLLPVLAAWIPAANELNRKMSQKDHWTLIPQTVFVHSRSNVGEGGTADGKPQR